MAFATAQGVVAVAAVQFVVAVTAIQVVIAVVTIQGIVTVIAGDIVVFFAAVDGVVGDPAIARCAVVFEGFLCDVAYFQRGVIELEMVLVG